MSNDGRVDLGHWSIATTLVTVAKEAENLVTLILGYWYLIYGWVMGRGVDIGQLQLTMSIWRSNEYFLLVASDLNHVVRKIAVSRILYQCTVILLFDVFDVQNWNDSKMILIRPLLILKYNDNNKTSFHIKVTDIPEISDLIVVCVGMFWTFCQKGLWSRVICYQGAGLFNIRILGWSVQGCKFF